MSFFGFDPTAPPQQQQQQQQGGQKKDEVYDFENTYDGLGELEEDDALNSETFGTSTQEIRKDFDFGHGNSKEPTPQASNAPVSTIPQGISYAQAAAQPGNDDEFMEDLWGSSNAPGKQQQENAGNGKNEKKILSLEEIEAQLTAIDQSQQQPQQAIPPPQQQQQFPPQPYGMPGMMPPPPQFGYMMAPGFIPPQYGYPGMIPQQMPPMPPQQQQGQGQQVPPAPQQQQVQQLQVQQQQAPQVGEQGKSSPSPAQPQRNRKRLIYLSSQYWVLKRLSNSNNNKVNNNKTNNTIKINTITIIINSNNIIINSNSNNIMVDMVITVNHWKN